MSHADAALYWLAYAQGKMGARSEALSTLLQLQKAYPKSKWVADGKTLEVEIRQSAGQVIRPEHVEDEEVKLMAINGLMNSDPERAIPILEGILNGNQPVKLKERALFVLSQSGSQRAFVIVVRTAKSGPPDLRLRAVRTLGILGGERSRGVLTDIYNSTSDVSVKKSVLKSYMISGDRTRLLALAKGEPNQELRADAVLQLGVIGARNELTELYNSEPSVDVQAGRRAEHDVVDEFRLGLGQPAGEVVRGALFVQRVGGDVHSKNAHAASSPPSRRSPLA